MAPKRASSTPSSGSRQSGPNRRSPYGARHPPVPTGSGVRTNLDRHMDADNYWGSPGYDGAHPEGDPALAVLRESYSPILDICKDAFCREESPSEKHMHHVRLFLREGADIDRIDPISGGTALHFAAGTGSEYLVDDLLQNGARVCARDRKLCTPLWWAIQHNHWDVCYRLLVYEKRGQRIVRKHVPTLPNVHKMTPLHFAAELGHETIVRLLVKIYKGPGGKPGVDVLGGKHMKTPLHVASENFQLTVCRLLLEEKADPQLACSHGKTALHYAAAHGVGAIDLCKMMSDHRPTCLRLRDSSGNTPLEVANRAGQLSDELWMVLSDRGGIAARDPYFADAAVRSALKYGVPQFLKFG